MEERHGLRRGGFVVQRACGPEHAGQVGGAVDLPAIRCSLLLDGALKPFQEEVSRVPFGVGVVALGLPVYLFLFRNKRLVEGRTMQ